MVGGWLTIFKGAPNVDLAKKLALDLLDPENFNRMSAVGGGLFMPAFENLWTAGTARGRSELRDHQGAGERARAVHRHLLAGEPERRDRRDPAAGGDGAGRAAT